MDNIPTAEEIRKKYIPHGTINIKGGYLEERKAITNAMIEFAKLHVEAALKAAAEKAQLDEHQIDEDENGYRTISEINEESILNSYPLENIK